MSDLHGIQSSPELFAVARAMEREAARRYEDLAARMRLRGEPKLYELFKFLARIEGKHAAHIEQESLRTTGQAVRDAGLQWEVPENFDEESASSQLLTPYLALAIAVRNEERAFAFYCYVAAEAREAAIRVLAEELAKDELGHAKLLRHERRKAYREPSTTSAIRSRAIPATVEELLANALSLESAAATNHRALAEQLSDNDPALAQLFSRAAADEQATAMQAAQRLGAKLPVRKPAAAASIGDGLRILEEAFNFYADVAERSDSEQVIAEAQNLAGATVRRLALARGEMTQDRLKDW